MPAWEGDGFVVSCWEGEEMFQGLGPAQPLEGRRPAVEGAPRRRLYAATGIGRQHLAEVGLSEQSSRGFTPGTIAEDGGMTL